jgi:hypothetical protein
MGAADWIAIYAAIVATGALSLEVRRWFESGPKIYLRATPNIMVVGYAGVEHRDLLKVTAVNRGEIPTTIVNLCLMEYPNFWARWRDKPSQSFVVPHPALPGYTQVMPYVLNTGEQWSGYAHDQPDVTGDIQTGKMWAAIYTTDREKPYLAHIKKRAPDKLKNATPI